MWEEECFRAFGEGRPPAPCPACDRTGFYGPRFLDPDRRYRQCRFCGFTQDVDTAPTRYLPTVHQCDAWPECARAPYIWWVAPDTEAYRCAFCQGQVDVAISQVTPPFDDADHPWWRVPQDRKRFYYLRFWENWEVTKGRVHL